MPRQGRELEKLVAQLEYVLSDTPFKVKSPDFLKDRSSGTVREVDVSVRGRVGSVDLLVIYECRDRDETEDVTWIEQIAQKGEDVGAHRVVAVSSEGFTQGATNKAAAKDVVLRTVADVDVTDLFDWLHAGAVNVAAQHARLSGVRVILPKDTSSEVFKALTDERSDMMSEDPILVRLRDGVEVSANELWSAAIERGLFDSNWNALISDALWDELAPGQERQVTLRWPTTEYATRVGGEIINIVGIEFFDATIWNETKTAPFTSLRKYLEGDTVLTETVDAEIDTDQGRWKVRIHMSRSGGPGGRRLSIVTERLNS